ncbi:hypothetical protein BDV10DRAFT_163492, partial [Aspergillus recurvatus]
LFCPLLASATAGFTGQYCWRQSLISSCSASIKARRSGGLHECESWMVHIAVSAGEPACAGPYICPGIYAAKRGSIPFRYYGRREEWIAGGVK